MSLSGKFPCDSKRNMITDMKMFIEVRKGKKGVWVVAEPFDLQPIRFLWKRGVLALGDDFWVRAQILNANEYVEQHITTYHQCRFVNLKTWITTSIYLSIYVYSYLSRSARIYKAMIFFNSSCQTWLEENISFEFTWYNLSFVCQIFFHKQYF